MLTKTLPSALSIWVPGAVIQIRVNVPIFVWLQISALSAGMLLFLKTVLQAVSNFLLIIIFLLPSMQRQSYNFFFLSCWLLLFIGSMLILRIWTPVGTLLMLILCRPTICKVVSGILRQPVLYPLFILWLYAVLGQSLDEGNCKLHTMLLHQVKTLLFPIYQHFYHVSSSVHSFFISPIS